jgi:DNA-binding transcriptional LysR family regulator
VSSPVDLDLRVVRYFVAVAEHRHFGRAAAALHMTQPSLSRQIRGLERQLGATLFERTPQGSVLTDAGRALLSHATALLDAAARAAAHTRAATAPHRVAIGYTTNLVVSAAVRALRRHRPDADIVTQHLTWDGARPALLDHRVDVAVTRLPIATDGLDVTVLYREPRVVLVSRRHRLADRPSLTLADIAGEIMPRTGDAAWDAFWANGSRPDGPVLGTAAETFDFVADNDAVLIVPADSRAPDLQPDLVTVPLHGVEPGTVAAVRRAEPPNPLVTAFTDCARTHMRAGKPSPRS